jgi:DNA-binding CsgD family transcriptional regulator
MLPAVRRGRPAYPDVLTPREWEVLALIQEGLTNPQIAQRLGISEHGARYHVSEILSKLGVQSREEAAEWRVGRKRLALGGLLMKWAAAGPVAVAILALVLLAVGVLTMDSRVSSDLDSLEAATETTSTPTPVPTSAVARPSPTVVPTPDLRPPNATPNPLPVSVMEELSAFAQTQGRVFSGDCAISSVIGQLCYLVLASEGSQLTVRLQFPASDVTYRLILDQDALGIYKIVHWERACCI